MPRQIRIVLYPAGECRGLWSFPQRTCQFCTITGAPSGVADSLGDKRPRRDNMPPTTQSPAELLFRCWESKIQLHTMLRPPGLGRADKSPVLHVRKCGGGYLIGVTAQHRLPYAVRGGTMAGEARAGLPGAHAGVRPSHADRRTLFPARHV